MGRDSMTILDHLSELRNRVIQILIVVIVLFAIGLYFVEYLFEFIIKPFDGEQLIFISPSEAFLANLKLALISALILAFPFILYQILAFVLPAFKKQKRRHIILFFISIIIMFFLGISFAYFVVAPIALNFFLSFAKNNLAAQISISSYQNFVLNMMFAFGMVFQAPIMFMLLGKMGLVTSKFLRKNWKYGILIIVIVSAFITPPDVFSQILMIVPLLILFELSILLVKLNERKKNKKSRSFL